LIIWKRDVINNVEKALRPFGRLRDLRAQGPFTSLVLRHGAFAFDKLRQRLPTIDSLKEYLSN
jgi:hypothetical protein